eukprot:5965527-Pleurochrysis_carterae.AAC.2
MKPTNHNGPQQKYQWSVATTPRHKSRRWANRYHVDAREGPSGRSSVERFARQERQLREAERQRGEAQQVATEANAARQRAQDALEQVQRADADIVRSLQAIARTQHKMRAF